MFRNRRHFLRATLGGWTGVALLRPRRGAGDQSLTRCSSCGALRGPGQHASGRSVDVHCWCESPRCDRCGYLVWSKSPAPYYFNERRQRVVYVPGFATLVHKCRWPARRRRGRRGACAGPAVEPWRFPSWL